MFFRPESGPHGFFLFLVEVYKWQLKQVFQHSCVALPALDITAITAQRKIYLC